MSEQLLDVRDLSIGAFRHGVAQSIVDKVSFTGSTAAGRRTNIRGRLQEISGIVPSLREEIVGCAFAPRCSYAVERCSNERPGLDSHGPAHVAACWEAARLASR